MNTDTLVKTIKDFGHYAVYGASVTAAGAVTAAAKLCGILPDCYLVSNPETNKAQISGVSVCGINENNMSKNTPIIIGTVPFFHAEIEKQLRENGFTNIIPLTSHLEYELQKIQYDGVLPGFDSEYLPGFANGKNDQNKLRVFEVRTHRGVTLKNPPGLKIYETPIHAGAIDTNRKICELTDDFGDNISEKNAVFCETTAFYAVWKNLPYDGFVGFNQYRRHLIPSENRPKKIKTGGTDAYLTYPYTCLENAENHLKMFINDDLFEAVKIGFGTAFPDKYNAFLRVLSGEYYYPYNIFILRDTVFNEYCEFIFKALFEIEKAAAKMPGSSPPKSFGYVAEILSTFFFCEMLNKSQINHIEREIYT